MKVNVYDLNGPGSRRYNGWIDLNETKKIATSSDAGFWYELLVTRFGKLIIHCFNLTGYDVYRYPASEAEIAEILGSAQKDRSGYNKKLKKILTKYEI